MLSRIVPSRRASPLRALVVLLLLAPWLGTTWVVFAQPPSAPAPSASAAASAQASPAEPDEPADPRVEELTTTEARVRALAKGELDMAIEPRSLFPIDPGDAKAVRLQRARLTLLLAAVDEAARAGAGTPAAPPADGGVPEAPTDGGPAARDAAVDTGDAGSAGDWLPDDMPPRDVPEAIWAARISLDRARLAFYELSDGERERLLAEHAAKSAPPASDTATEQQVDEAERKAADAENERKRALEAAARARTEAQRAVAEEQARLLGVTKAQADVEGRLARRRGELAGRADRVIAWQRRVRELLDRAPTGEASEEVDRAYEELRAALRESRSRLAGALDAVGAPSEVPEPGADALSDLPAEVDTSAAREIRARAEAGARQLAAAEQALRLDIAKGAHDEVVALNSERLRLYRYLSREKRGAIAGFGPAGIDQARAEAWQVSLVVRYHLSATSRWVTSMRSGETRGQSALTATLLAVRWLLPIALFIAWVRRAPALIERARASAREKATSISKTPAERAIDFFARVRRPLEWLLVSLTVLWLLPGEMRRLWELQIIETTVLWTFGGQLVVAAVDATFGDRGGVRESRLQTAHLRLRSFRLIGRVVVTVGLVLAITNQLVGRGTIYEWVWSTCWLGLLPLAVVLGHWWKDVVFTRIELRRRKSAFDEWVLSKKSGWRSVVGGIAGGLYLLGTSGLRTARSWVTKFELSRRILAYLFLRGMSKRAENAVAEPLEPLPGGVFEALGPSTASASIVPSVADSQLRVLAERIQRTGGGVFAVVGERGAGKTTTLRRLAGEIDHVSYVQCPFEGSEGLAKSLAEAVGRNDGAALDDLARDLDDASSADHREGALLIDDAHRLIQPRMGGLDEFDALLAVARRRSQHNAWIFAFDETIWRFFERARGARPLFDEVISLERWKEEGIARLLVTRSKTARVSPLFDRLLEDLPKDADEIDIREATERAATGYYRLLWDYAGGNPGVALHMWRRSLGATAAGEITVKLFAAPDEYELDALPDNAVFVLRAVLQLERARPADIADATMLAAADVADSLRYGAARGYLSEEGGRYHITWAWYRPITRLLRRRHLLFSR